MNIADEKYSRYAIVKEMMEVPDIIRNFNPSVAQHYVKKAKAKKGIFFTGEGSSRIFPAKRAKYSLLKSGSFLPVAIEGATQALEYPLNDFAVFCASNSGKTREVIRLVSSLKHRNHSAIFGLTANSNTKLHELVPDTHVMSCGKEEAVPATKSVVEQGLFYDAMIRGITGQEMIGLKELADKIDEILTASINPEVIERVKSADIIYFAGRNNGVAEELVLKANEITRKKSIFLEGTFAVHGVEEVMNKNEILIWIEPFADEVNKFEECLVKGIGIDIIAISVEKSRFPEIIIPYGGQYAEYVQLAAGWNLLVETGIELGIDIDKPLRARKIGNEFITS